MPDDDNTQAATVQDGQGSDNLKNQDNATQTQTTDTSTGTSQNGKQTGQGDDFDFKKGYNEIQPQFTKVTTENAELKKKLEDAETKISSSKPPDTAIPKPDDSIEAQRQTLRSEIQYLKGEGSSTLTREIALRQLDQEEKSLQIEQFQQRENDDVAKFTSNEVFSEEMKNKIYADTDLIAIKREKANSGLIIDYETARDIWISKNQAKYAQAIIDQKTKAQGAITQDSGTALPTETKEEGAAQKMVSGWGTKPA